MKKNVSSSHLALRFYKRAGWTLACLTPYLKKGIIKDTEETHGDSPEDAYFIPDVGSVLDMEALLRNEVLQIFRWYSGPARESDLDYLKSFNW